jgi:uncharacterized membrane protein YccC
MSGALRNAWKAAASAVRTGSASVVQSSRPLKNAFKMALAAALAMLAHDLMHEVAQILPSIFSFADPSRKAWSVLTACVVMQSNLGNSIQTSSTRLIGTGVGALIGALAVSVLVPFKADFHWLLSVFVVGVAVGLTSLICTAIGLKSSLRLACMTLALVVVTCLDPRRHDDPWLIARERFFDSCIGIGAALLVLVLVFPEPAEKELRQSLVKVLQGCTALQQSAMDAYLLGTCPPERDGLRARVREERQKNLALLTDLASEPGSLRPERLRLVALADDAGDLTESLIALDDAAQALRRDEYLTRMDRLGPELLTLSRAITAGVEWVIKDLGGATPTEPPPDLEQAMKAIDARFLRLSEQGLLRHYTPPELLRFCSFLFNLRAVGREVVHLLTTAGTNRAQSLAEEKPAPQPTERELLEAYRKTEYRVEGPQGPFCICVDQRCPELEQVLGDAGATSWAYVTAYNPGSRPLSAEENARRQTELEVDVAALGLTFHRGAGAAPDGSWPAEPSVLILGIGRDAAVALARKYGQLALLFAAAGQPAQLLWV